MSTEEDLAKACFELARTAKWTQRPIDASEIISLAARFETIAKERKSEELAIDEPILTRAVRYIAQAHGMPFGDDTRWFENMLTALLEVARPNSGLDLNGRAFLRDMMDGIEDSLAAE
jgi:hypothetical protein